MDIKVANTAPFLSMGLVLLDPVKSVVPGTANRERVALSLCNEEDLTLFYLIIDASKDVSPK